MSGFSESEAFLEYFSNRGIGVMIDVGAHFGSTLKPYLQRGWRVIACEPDPAKFPKLQRFDVGPNFTLIKAAVGEFEQEAAEFFTSEESTGISSLTPFRTSHVRSASVSVTTLSRIVEDCDVRDLDFLKVDAEGSDYAVLRGFPWSHLKPEVVLCEFDEKKRSGSEPGYRELGDFLIDRDYCVWMSEWFPIVRDGGNHRWRSVRRYPCELEDPEAWGNYIAVRTDKDVIRMESILRALEHPDHPALR